MRSNATSVARSARVGVVGAAWVKLPDPHLPAELGVRPLPPLVLQGGHAGEVVAADEHVARVDRLPR